MQPEIRAVWEKLLSYLEDGEAVLVVAKGHIEGVPDIHNFYRKNPEKADQYWRSIKHCGFGFFEGRTEHGEFSFDAGGAMRHVQSGDEWISWSPLRASAEVLKDLEYDFDSVKAAIKRILEGP